MKKSTSVLVGCFVGGIGICIGGMIVGSLLVAIFGLVLIMGSHLLLQIL